MLEMLLRLFGLKRRRRRVYVQPPLPAGGGSARPRTDKPAAGAMADLRRQAEILTAEQAAKVQRAREAKKAEGLARLPLIGGMLAPKRKSRGASMPLPPGQMQDRKPGEAPTTTQTAAPRAKRTKKGLRVILREAAAEIDKTWSGPAGRSARLGLRVLVVYVLPALAVGVPAYLLIGEMRLIGVEVAPIAVPESVARTGRTPDVLAQLLIDQVDVVRRDTLLDRDERWPQDLSGRQPPFVLLSQADTLHQIAVWLRGLTPQPARMLTGAVTEMPDGKLSVRLYLTGMNRGAPVAALESFPSDELNRVVAGAAPLMVRAISPRMYAWYVAETEQRQETLQTALNGLLSDPASGTVDTGTRDTVDFLLARGLARSGRADEAQELAEAIVKRSPRYPPAYYARAIAAQAQGDDEAALAAVAEAQRLDGGNAWS